MPQSLEQFATIERTYIKEDIKWLKAGGKILSPSGDDISSKKMEELEARLESANLVLSGK